MFPRESGHDRKPRSCTIHSGGNDEQYQTEVHGDSYGEDGCADHG